MRPDLRSQAVLERRDDPAARRVVLRVRRGDHVQVQRQTDGEPADLDVALLEHVEQPDLDPLGEVGQLVDRDDAAVGARDQAVVEGQLVRQVAALGDLDRVDLADEVGDRDVRRGELLGVAPVARQPVDGGLVAVALHDGLGGRADRRVRVVVELAAADDRDPLVEQADQQAGHPGLRLAAFAEEHDVVAGQDRVLDRGRTVSSKPTTVGSTSAPVARRSSRFDRSSSLTVRERQPAARSSAMVAGRAGVGMR